MLEQILTYLKIDDKTLELIENFKTSPKAYEKDVIELIVNQTKYDYDAIKYLTNNYSNATMLKQYFGFKQGEITKNLKKVNVENINALSQIISDILVSKNVSKTYKTMLLSAPISSTLLLSIKTELSKKIKNLLDKDISCFNKELFILKYLTDSLNEIKKYLIEYELKTLEEYENMLSNILVNRKLILEVVKNNKEDILSDDVFDLYIYLVKDLNLLEKEDALFLFNLCEKLSTKNKIDVYEKFSFSKFSDLISLKDIENIFELSLEKLELINKKNKYVNNLTIYLKDIGLFKSSLIKYLIDTPYDYFLSRVFFEKANLEIDNLIELTKYTKNFTNEEMVTLKRELSDISRNSTNLTKYYFVNQLGLILWTDYTSPIITDDVKFFNKNRVEFENLVKRILSLDIDDRNLEIFNNEGNFSGFSITKKIYYFIFTEKNTSSHNQMSLELLCNEKNEMKMKTLFDKEESLIFNLIYDNFEIIKEKNKKNAVNCLINKANNIIKYKDLYLKYFSLDKYVLKLIRKSMILKGRMVNVNSVYTKEEATIINETLMLDFDLLIKELENLNFDFSTINLETLKDDEKERFLRYLIETKNELAFINFFNYENVCNYLNLVFNEETKISEESLFSVLLKDIKNVLSDIKNVKRILFFALKTNNTNLINLIKNNNTNGSLLNFEISKEILKIEKEMVDKNSVLLPNNLTSLTNEKRAEALNFLSKELKSILKLS